MPVGGMWVEADMNLPSGESLARQIVHGQRWFESRFGQRCTEVWIPDVFGYPAGMPQLYAAGGMQRFVTQKLSWNTTNRFPHHTFWWEGLDGTRVLTHFPPVDTYNAEITPAEVRAVGDRFRDAGVDGLVADAVRSRRRRRRTDPRDARACTSAGRRRRRRRTVSIGSPAEFFEQVEREAFDGAPVPVWRGELYFETHRGTLTSQLRTKVGNRRCERLLREVELWSATRGRARRRRRAVARGAHPAVPRHHPRARRSPGSTPTPSRCTRRSAETLEARLAELFDELVPATPHVANAAGVDRDEVIEVPGDRPIRVRVPANGIAPLVEPSAPTIGSS